MRNHHPANEVSRPRSLRAIVGAILIVVTLVLLLTAGPLSAVRSVASEGESAVEVANLFALRACAAADPLFCPNGQFDEAVFAQMYAQPEQFLEQYPAGETGAYARRTVPTCESDDCAGELISCTDGTRPLYYYKPGSGADADKWIIKIQGGGGTCGERDCGLAYATNLRDDLSSAYGQNPDRQNSRGILSTRPDNLFRDYNLVFLDKCVGDRNLGDVTVEEYEIAPNVTGPVHFHGYRIILAVLQELKEQAGADPNLADADTIAFMTQSNGSNGGYLYVDRVRDYVMDEIAAPDNAPDVRYLASSYVMPGPETEYALAQPVGAAGRQGGGYQGIYGHVDDQTTAMTVCGNGFDPANPLYQDWLDESMQVDGPAKCGFGIGGDHLRGIGSMFYSTADYLSGREAGYLAVWGATGATPTIDDSCYQAHLATGDTEACSDSLHVQLYHLTTPTLYGAQKGDRNLRVARLSSWTTTFDPLLCDAGDPACHSENFRGDTDPFGDPAPSEGAWRKEDFQLRVMAILNERFNGQSSHQEQPSGNGHGAFIDNTVAHMGFAQMSKMRRTMAASAGADSLELQEYLATWLDPANRLQVVCVDDGPLYDVEFAPPVLLADAPAGLACDSGAYYDPATPVDPEQACNDPFANTASQDFPCLVQPIIENFLPIMSGSSQE